MVVLICGSHHEQDSAKFSKLAACRAKQSRNSAMARSTRNSRVRVSDRSPHFFKVFFPQLSSEHLKIPPKFWEHIQASQAAAHTISLNGPSGSTWNMDLVKNSDGLFLKNGWKEFVVDNSLALGDFLVFRYDGELRFTVLLFDNTACEKKAALSAMPCEDDVIVLDMGTGEENVSEEASKVSTTDCVTLKRRERESDDCVTLAESLQKKRSKVSTQNSKDPSDNLPSLSTHSPSSYSKATRCSPRKHNQEHETLNENPSPQRRVVEDGSSPTILKPQSSNNFPSLSTHSPSSYSKATRYSPRKHNQEHETLNENPSPQRRVVEDGSSSTTLKPQSSNNLPSLSTHSPSSYSKATRCSPRKHKQEHETLNEIPSPQRRVVEDDSSPTTLKPQSASKKPNNSSRTSTFTLSDNMPSKHSPLMKSSCQIPRFGKFYFLFKEQRIPRMISQRRPVTEEELNKARQMSKLFKSTNPYVKIEMKEWSLYFKLRIPLYFVREYLPDENMKMSLCDPNGKLWEVTYIFDGLRGGLGAGWRVFAVVNNLEIGDVCIFELIKKYHFRVHFCRVVEEIEPLLWNCEARS